MEGTEGQTQEVRGPTSAQLMRYWKAGPFNKHHFLKRIRDQRYFGGVVDDAVPDQVYADDIVMQLSEDIRHLTTELDWKFVKLADRVEHIHDQQEYGT